MSDVTRILDRVQQGEAKPAEELLPLVYDELRKLAAQKMAQQEPGQTLQPTALVHEAWLKLTARASHSWNDRQRFFRAAAEAMRCILVDHARQRKACKHGGDLRRTELAEFKIPHPSSDDELMAVHEALNTLARESGALPLARKARASAPSPAAGQRSAWAANSRTRGLARSKASRSSTRSGIIASAKAVSI